MGQMRQILAAGLLALLLAACGQASTNTTSPTAAAGVADAPTAAAEATSAAEPAADATAAAEPVADLGGRTLVVGSDTTYPPMEFVNEQTRAIEGFDVDMMNAIAEQINAEIEFQTYPSFDTIFAALAQGQFDLVVSSVSITEERKQTIDFSDPYLSIGQAIAVQEDNSAITGQAELTSAEVIGVQGGTTGEQAVQELGVPDTQIKRYETIDLAFQDLANGAVDAVVADGPPVARYTDAIPGLKAVGEPFTTENYGIALQKGDAELQTAINAALAELKANGTLQQLLEKWNLDDVATIP